MRALTIDCGTGEASEHAGTLADETSRAAELAAWRADQAMRALRASDIVVLRCYEEGVAVPVDWVLYRSALRLALNGQGDLPARPERP